MFRCGINWNHGMHSIYPLTIQHSYGKWTMFNGYIIYKWVMFPSYMLNNQRVSQVAVAISTSNGLILRHPDLPSTNVCERLRSSAYISPRTATFIAWTCFWTILWIVTGNQNKSDRYTCTWVKYRLL